MMCSGTLTIAPRASGGTRVTVVIPLKQPMPEPEAEKDGGTRIL